ncbi:SCO2322 family protein [Streptomyces sp. A1136]|uniref:SCO2322 family protein n=1 Tax=Streptomyces sp. A1136 TaxID=2563102 RepID=UPI00109E9869|nr:SCO2322 family protein [Streptomyces sp. A1136]THA54128.1 hypothetical protein E6R62_16220 [Streptomyces sp. A1136]
MRRLPALAVTLGVLLTLLAASPALASSYRYWSFWDGGAKGPWTYATQGTAARPADGTVQGFRFAVSKDAEDEASRPRTAADFAALCAGTPAVDGKKRVALVVDFGVPGDSPPGEAPPQAGPRTACAQVAPDATTAEALASVAKPLRYNSAALLCAISGYPRQGCGEPLADGTREEPKTAPAGDGGPSAGLLAGVAAVAVLAVAAVLRSRRRSR